MALFDKIKDFVKPFVESTSLDQPKVQTSTTSVFKPAAKTTAVDAVSSAAPKASVFKPASKTTQPTLSSMSIQNDRQKGIDWSSASPAQQKYNSTYYKTLDDPAHTKMFRDLQSYSYRTAGGSDVDKTAAFRKSYKEGTAYLDNELEDYAQRYGKDSYEYKALQQFKGDYESLGRDVAVQQGSNAASKLSSQLDKSIQNIYGGLMTKPDFQEKAAEGKAKLAKSPLNLYETFDTDYQNATDLQKSLIDYLYATEGKKGVRQFLASGLGQQLTLSSAYKLYSETLNNDSEAFRGSSVGAQDIVQGIMDIPQNTYRFIQDLAGSSEDDPEDRNLGGGYTISDATDNYLSSTLAKDFEEAGVTTAQFNYLAEQGELALGQISADWAKDALKNASDYQKQVLSFILLASGEEAASAMWDGIKEYEQTVWDATKKGSNRLATSVDEMLQPMYGEYLGLGGKELSGFFADVGGGEGVTMEQMLHSSARSAANQLIPMAMSMGLGGLFKAAGAATKAANVASRVAGAAPMATMIGGQAYDEAKESGAGRGKALGYAITEAGLEFLTDEMLGRFGAFTGRLTGGLRDKAVSKIASPLLRALTDMGIGAFSEGVQEYVQEALEPMISDIFLDEGNWKDTFALDKALDPDRLYAGFLGSLTALMMTPGAAIQGIKSNRFYTAWGKSMDAPTLAKTVDLILNTGLTEKTAVDAEALEAARKTAELIKNGTKVSDLAAGKMVIDFMDAGGDLSNLRHLDTMGYNKDTLTEENFIAGATSRLSELGADTTLAGDIARWAMGQQPSQEAFNKIKSDPRATQVLQELIDPLDMEQDNALTRAVQSTTRDVTGNKTYDTLVASNPDQTVVNPATQQLISLGVELEEAQDIGDVIAKVMSGETITEDEAELISVSNAAVRSVLSEVAGVELSEDATIGAVMAALNAVATEAADTKAKQGAVAEGAEAAARARMPIPPNTRQTITAGGIEFGHDDFIKNYRAQHNATLEQAEAAWAQRAGISAALNGEEENNGTTPGKQEGRNPDLAGRSPIPAATQRTAESGRAADTGGTEQSGRVVESGQSADLRRGYTDDQVITAFNSKQRAFMRSCLDAGFKTTKLIKGPILRQGVDKDGNPATYEVNALVDDDGNLVIRWDNPYASPLRVALHERIHLWLSSMPDSERAAFVKQALQDIFGDNTAAFDAMYKAYAEVYAKAYTGLTGEVFAAHVLEEMLADMYAGMNNYGANAGSYQSQAEMYVQQSGLREKFFGEEGGFSFDEQFSLNDPFRGDVDRSKPPETRPFPGEKAMHDNMELLSLTSMAQGANFELRLNSQGQPYELIDKKTGKRVEHVTGEMMIDTPLGNIVQLAVDNGNIDADEAAQQRDMLASAMNLIVDYDDAALVWELVGSQMFSAVKANSDKQYNKTIDFSTICKKTMAIVDAMSETMKKLGRGLTRREVEIVYEEVGKKGLATPCPVCYVFSRWMGIGGLLDQMNRFQVKYGNMSEEEIVAFMTRIEDEAWEYAKKNPKSTYFDKNAPHTRDNMLIGKVISDMKSGPNSKAAAAIETLNAHQQALATIAELEKAKEKATPAMAKKYGEMIRQLRYNVKSEKALAAAEAKMQAAEADIEPYEEYQWLAKTMMISDSSQVNEDGESVGNWKRNPNFKPVPQDILFDLNKGGEFAKDYPLSWAFRTGKGCAAGKAIAPYSDARVGETIQGVATDVKNIRVELDESQHDSFVEDFMRRNNATKEVAEEAWQNRPHNEFQTGDTKTQQKTLKTARKKQRQQNLIGGMRYQSTSDFRYEFGSDYLMTFLEMQALGANVQLYTKVIEAVDFLASTGADCNLSVMPLGDGYEEYIDPETGEKKLRLIFSNITGINADAAIKKSQEYDNVQLILVGINDTNIRLALEGDEVTFVIPFHGSGQSVHQIQTLMDMIGERLDVTQAQDYTSVQSDRAIKDRAEKHPELQAMWDLRMDIIMGKFLTDEQKETLKAWENATSQEEKTALANRLAELGKAQEGLSAEQKARLAQNKHLQKLYDMFYADTTDPAFYNNLAKDQAEHIFPYEYWIKDGDYAHADENGRVFQEYCASIGVIPRFSGINSKYQKTGFGDFTQDKGYWKLLIDRSMYENVYDEKGNWIGYGKYRPQQQINMTNIDIGDLNPETGKAQFQNGEMSKQYDATRNPEDLAKRDNIVSDSIKRIEAMRGSADVVERNALDRTRVKKDFREKVMKAQSALRENDRPVERYSLAPVSAVEPKSDSWNRTHTTEEALEIYPDLWNVSAEESETRNPTQIASTQGTYRNIYKILQDQGFDGKILDASSGLGIGTQIGRDEFGFDVEDIEPYPGENYSPMYTDYSKLNKKYDAIISSAVLNVLPQDQRDALVVKMGELLNDGGKMYITTRGKDVDSLAKTGKNIQLGPMEWIETVRGSYQKGFTQNELKAYLEDALGPGFTVELSNKSNGGKFNNNTSIVVTKNGASAPTERYSVAENQEVFEAPYTSEADWRKAVKDRSIEYTPEMEKRWGLSGGDMTDADAAITEALDKIEEIQARPDRKWFIRDITDLSWYKEGFTNVIDLMNSGENGKKLLKFMLRNVDEKNLNLLSQYLVLHYLPDVRKRSQKEINAFKKIVKARSDQIANERGIGHNLNVSARKTYTLSDIRSMFEQLNDDPENAALAQKIFDWAEELEQRGFIPAPFKFRSISDANGKQWGTKIRYDTNYFNDPRVSDARKAKTILHELIHKYSAYAIDLVHTHDNVGNYASYSLREAYNTLPQNIIQAVYTLDDIYDQIKYDPLFLDANGKPMYGTKNVYEMLAELSNPEFREALKKKTLWQRILDAVKKLFGIDTTNAYDSVSAAFDKLMSSYDLYRVEETYENFMQRTQNGYDRFSVAPTDQNSTPFKEGSLEATVSDLIQKADDGQALQDTINALIEKRNESLKRDNAPVIPSKDKARPVGKVQREIQQNQLQDLINKYGALKKGEKAAKDVTLPERTSDERYTRRFVRTTEEAAGIPERMNERIDDSLLTEDLLTYSRITDKMAVKKGDSDFKSLGYKKAIKEWNENRAGTGHQPTKYDIAFGERLMIEAARNGDEAVALKVLADLASMETQAGQVVQAARLLKKLGPTGQLYYIQKAVDRLNKQNEGRIAKGSMQPITIDKELAKAVILSETDEQMKDAMDELIASIAEQLPVTLKDKWDAWRYLSMLGNPRTHIRNVFGNAVFSPIRFTKDLLASAGEKMFIKDPLERTKSADARLGSKKYDAVREFAASDFEEMKQQITGTGKMNPLNEIMDKRKIFKSKAFGWLNKLSDWNSDMLEKEDAIFLRKAYIDAMTQFIAAKGLTLEELTGSYEGGKLLNDARQYAALEAQKATYRDFNQMASALNQMKRTSGVGWFIDGLMPFTKTPMNILRRGIEYSPVGLANGIYSSLVRVGKGDISAAGAIDQIAAGMTGTGIAILGYFLAKMGLARGGDDDDEKKAQLEAAEGHQNYSLEIPGYGSYTIDWMAPVALPFFVGVEVFNQLSDGGPVTGWDLANAITMIAEPMMSLSMLDGLNSTLSAVRYGDKDEAVMSVATNILTSYLSQGAPTIFGQIARTIDPDRRSTYTDKNSSTPAWLQRFVQGVQGKAPGAESQKMAYVDAWGRKDTNASLFWRAVENFISPGYANRINETPVDRELTRLAESLGDTSVLPSSISKYYQLNGERLDLNAKQYEKLKTVTGQTAFSLLGNMMDDVAYIAMGDEEKAAVVKQIMSISAAIGKQAVTPDYKPDAWIQRAIDQDNLENAAVYHALEKLDTGLSNYQLISAMDWLTDEDRGKLIMSEHTNTSRNMTDYTKKKYKFVLTDEQIAREREIYDGLFWPEYANLINDPKYINAGVAERADMISKMQSSLGEAARRQLGDELRAAGYTSVLLDDSDVPEQVIDLYSLLNRG